MKLTDSVLREDDQDEAVEVRLTGPVRRQITRAEEKMLNVAARDRCELQTLWSDAAAAAAAVGGGGTSSHAA